MAVATEVIAREYLDVSAGTDISVDIAAFESGDVYVHYGIEGFTAVQGADYAVTLAEDFDTFTITPTASLIAKIDALMAADDDEVNAVTVRRELDLLTEATASGVRYTPFTSREFDRNAMRDQQLSDGVARSVRLGDRFSAPYPDLTIREVPSDTSDEPVLVLKSEGGVGAGVGTQQILDAVGASASVLAFAAALDGYAISVEHNVIELSDNLDLRGVDLNLSNVKYTATSGVPVIQVGGYIDTGTTLTVSGALTVVEGARSITYNTLTGPLAAGDWVAIKGHMKNAFTNNSGRNVFWGAMMQVRSVDTDTNTIHLHQSIAANLDQVSVTDAAIYGDAGETLTATAITIEKVIPQRVNLQNIRLDGCYMVAEYVVDSTFDFYEDESDERTKLAVSYATNSQVSMVSRARQPNGGDHSLEINFFNGGRVSYRAMSANYTLATIPAKGLRGNCISNADIHVRAVSQAMQVATIQGITNCKLDMWASDAGTYNTDQSITSSNRNDAFKLEYLRKCTGSVASENPDCTAIEVFNAWDCNLSLSGWRHRPGYRKGTGGLISIKGAGRGSTYRVFFRETDMDQTGPVLRYEMFAVDDDGNLQGNDNLILDIETDGETGFNARDIPTGATTADAGTRVSGRVKAPIPFETLSGTTGFICEGLTLEVVDTGYGSGHCANIATDGCEFYGCHFMPKADRRAVSSYNGIGIVAKNCTGEGPLHLVAQDTADDAAFDITKFHGSDLTINFYESDSTLRVFNPHVSGGWEVSSIDEGFSGTIFEQVLDLPIGVWSEGDILWNYHATLGPYNWRWTGSDWVRHQMREARGFESFTTFGVATGASTLTYTVTGIEVRDEVNVRLADDAQGLTYQGMCNTDGTLTVEVQNNTGGVVTLPNSGWYWTARKHTTGQL